MKKLFLLFFLCSCGLKVTKEINENLLLGTWKMTDIKCYFPNVTAFTERYDLNNTTNLTVTMSIMASTFQYTVDAGSCTTSAYGKYTSNFNGDFSDVVDFVDIGSGSTCDVSLDFTNESNGSGTGTVKFALLPTYSKNLNWLLSDDRTTLTLDYFTNFNGSDVASYCVGTCECRAIFIKN